MSLLELLEDLEGRRKFPYESIEGGRPTIGIGHKITEKEFDTGIIYILGFPVLWKLGLTEKQIDDLAEQDLAWATKVVDVSVKVPITENQRNALISFVFNVGPANFFGSTLLKKLNVGKYDEIADELRKWVKITIDGRKVGPPEFGGLLSRREKEIKEWETVA